MSHTIYFLLIYKQNRGQGFIKRYWTFISSRASGAIPTVAQEMRRFIQAHPDYKKDSKVSEQITHDLIEKMFITKDKRNGINVL